MQKRINMKPTIKKHLSIILNIAAILLGIYQITVYRGGHNLFIGILWIIYGTVMLLTSTGETTPKKQ